MKILIVQDYLRSGGTERQSVFLANAFAGRGHEATLLTFRPGGKLRGTVSPAVKTLVLQSRDWGLDWWAPGLCRVARAAAPAAILCMGRMANSRGAALQRACPGAAVIATMRTGKRLPWLFRGSLREVSHVVANSEDARHVLERRYSVPTDKISVIYNSIMFAPLTARTGARRGEVRATHGAGNGTTVLLCVAMFRPEKNQRELIEIAAGWPANFDFQLWLAGEGPAKAECEQLVARNRLGEKVRFIGFTDDPTPLYEAADVAVHASASESLSNFLIEAQAHGVPAVAYEAQGISECFVPGQTGWVIARGDRESFRASVGHYMALPPPERANRTSIARAFARQRFDSARQVHAYLELFELLR
jgi:glycosyltransferase involved in cell wall biosynthesis